MTELATSSQVTEHRPRWKWFLAAGALLLALGLAGITVRDFAAVDLCARVRPDAAGE